MLRMMGSHIHSHPAHTSGPSPLAAHASVCCLTACASCKEARVNGPCLL